MKRRTKIYRSDLPLKPDGSIDIAVYCDEPKVDPVILDLIERGDRYVEALRKSADDRLPAASPTRPCG